MAYRAPSLKSPMEMEEKELGKRESAEAVASRVCSEGRLGDRKVREIV